MHSQEKVMRNKYGQTPQEVARATVLFNLERMATTEGYAAFEETPSFKREVRKHFAKINNTLAYKWRMDENTVDMKRVTGESNYE